MLSRNDNAINMHVILSVTYDISLPAPFDNSRKMQNLLFAVALENIVLLLLIMASCLLARLTDRSCRLSCLIYDDYGLTPGRLSLLPSVGR